MFQTKQRHQPFTLAAILQRIPAGVSFPIDVRALVLHTPSATTIHAGTCHQLPPLMFTSLIEANHLGRRLVFNPKSLSSPTELGVLLPRPS